MGVQIQVPDRATLLGRELDVNIYWTYDAGDPAAVCLLIDDRVAWLFGRELLKDACEAGWAGNGDVKLYRSEDELYVDLNSSTGQATLKVDADVAEAFVDKTYRLVSPAAESAYIADEIEGLLTSS